MRLTKSFAFAVSALALSTSAAFAGGDAMSADEQRAYEHSQQFLSYEQSGPELWSNPGSAEAPLTDQSDPMGYQPYAYRPYEQGGPETLSESELIGSLEMLDREYTAQPQEYEVYDVYVVPAEIVLIPLEEPSEAPISGS
jgi:hypothetical protein